MENINSRDDYDIELERNFSYDGYQVVRREMFAHLREPSIIIRKNNISFNKACIDGLEDTVYIQILINEIEKRIVIRKCKENDLDAVRWCIVKPDKRNSRPITGKFSDAVYKLMDWKSECRYKILGHLIEHDGDFLYVFELTKYEIVKERPKRTKEEQEARAASMTEEELKMADQAERREYRTAYFPEDAENTFGIPVEKHENTLTLGSWDKYVEMKGQK